METSDKLGRYWLLERIALGGMAEIHLAFVQGPGGFDRVVVLKVLRRDLVGDPDHVRMFLTEARTIARLNHPNIVHAHELEEADGTWFIAMEHVPGSSFRELLVTIRRSGVMLPPNVAVGLMLQACSGAHAAHELLDPSGKPLGLVHRDISPDNLMVRGDGHVKLLDFGIAKFSETQDEATRQGTLKGKIAYMSPEQCQQGALDRRSDVFSLGVVAWELLAASRLFRRESEYASMQAIVDGDLLSLDEARPGLPPDLVVAIERALALAPDDRHASAEALRQALVGVADQQGWDTSPACVGAFVAEHVGELQEARARELEAAITLAIAGPDNLDLLTDEVLPTEPLPTTEPLPAPAEERPRTGLIFGLLGIALGAAGTLWWLAEPPPPPVAQTESDGETEARVWTAPVLKLGLAPVMDAELYLAAHEGLRRHLEDTLDRPVELVPHGSYQALADALLDGSLDAASLPPKLYLETQDRGRLQLLAFKEVDGGSGTDSVMVVQEDDPIQRLDELAGQTICLTDPSSTTGYALPRAALEDAGVAPEAYTTHLSGNHLQVLRDLVAGDCRAAATYSDVLRAARTTEVQVGGLRVLALTGRSPQDGVCSGPHTPEAAAVALQAALLSFEPSPQDIQGVEPITGFVPGSDAAYDPLRRALHARP